MSADPTLPWPPEVARRFDEGAFLLVDKPRGPSSHQVTAWVRDLLRVPVAGHAGTLDPAVSGVLWIGTGSALKLLPLMLEFPKTYVALITFHAPVPTEELVAAVREFEGPVFQTPPVRSAVKRQRRIRRLLRLTILESSATELLLEAVVDSGTYIRTLAVDLGDALGVGGSLTELRRTATGPFTEAAAPSLAVLADAVHRADAGDAAPLVSLLHPISEVWRHYPRLRLRPAAAAAVAHGADLARGGIRSVEGTFAKGASVVLVTESDEIVAIGTALRDSEHLDGPGWAVDATRVLVPADRFPSLWRARTRPGGTPAPPSELPPAKGAGPPPEP